MMQGIGMNTLYIIGNGFDIAHGLDTRYWKLREFIEENDPEFLRQFEELYDIQPLDNTEYGYTNTAQEQWNKEVDHDLWSEFEKFMGTPNITNMLELSTSVTEGLPTDGIRHHMDLYWKEQYGFISKLQNYVKDWIETIDTSNIEAKKTALINSSDWFFNFNYTDLLEKTYRIENVLHIHGGVCSVTDIDPIMGHCNKSDMQNHKQWAKDADNEFEEAEASIQEAVYKYLNAIYKDTDEQIRFNQSFFDEIQSVEKIVVIGWSAGDVDIPYLRKIIKSVSADVMWEVYWYDDKAYNSLLRAFEHEGILNENIEYFQSNEFWDK